jgi:hypothetical protein
VSKVDLRLDWVGHDAAKFAVEHWHYSKRMPKFKQVYVGAWENSQFIGVVIFGLSVTPYLGDAFNLSVIECAELTRIALNRHQSPVSRIGAIALKMITHQSPGLRLIVSYADPFQGHNGSIYQAMNWVYVGRSSAVRQYYYRGDWRNDTPMFRDFAANPTLRKITPYRDLPPKHKYLYPLDDDMRRQIEPLRKPYPKRSSANEAIQDAPGDQPGMGGASPTRSL